MKRNGKQVIMTGISSLVLSGFMGATVLGGVASACSSDGGQHDAITYQQVSWRSDQSGSNSSSLTSQQLSDIRVAAHALLREHAAVSVPALKAELLQSPDKDAAMMAVENNNVAIADAVDKVFPGTRDEFLGFWRSHIGYYIDYLHAAKAGDEAGKEQAKQNLAAFAEQFSDWLVQHGGNYDKAEIKDLVSMHGDQVVHIIDSLVAGDYDEVYITAHEAYEHMGTIADTLVNGMATEIQQNY